MSVFGRATFSAAGYAAARPSYPASLFKTVLNYHNAKDSTGHLLDLGCGHGLIARELSPHFSRVTAIDPSAGMVKQASSTTTDPKVIFRQGRAEDLSFLANSSVDLAVAGQAAHWFDYAKVWPELHRVVKPGGSLAFWGYNDNVLVGFPKATALFNKFCYGEQEIAPGLEGMNSYWEQPGRSIVRRLMEDVEFPASQWEDVQRILCDVSGDTVPEDIPGIETAWLRRTATLGGYESYLRTFSAYQGWKDAHPEHKSKAEGGKGDIADMLIERMIEAEPELRKLGENWRDKEFETVWGTYILLAKRKA